MNIHSINKKQFNVVMRREGIKATDYYNHSKAYDIFIRRNKRGSNSQENKLRVYYSQDSGMKAGTIFLLKGEPYVLTSADGFESDIFLTSIAEKCDIVLNIFSNDLERYVSIPAALVSNVISADESDILNVVSGTLTLVTGINMYSDALSVNTDFNIFDGTWHAVNTFCNDGLKYVYFEQWARTNDKYTIEYSGNDSVMLSSGTYQLSFTFRKNGAEVADPVVSYNIDDADTASIDDNGLLTLHTAGNVSVTVVWTLNGKVLNTYTKTITIQSAESTENTIRITGGNELKANIARNFFARFYDDQGAEITDTEHTVTWSITSDFDSEIAREISGNKINLQISNVSRIGQTFTLSAACEGFKGASVEITIISTI